MLRSRAITLKEPYVLHPNANASPAMWQAYSSQIHQIAESKRIANRASATAQAETPAPACSSYWEQYESWPTIDGDNVYLSISWYSHEASGCNQIYLQTSVVQGQTSVNPLHIAMEAYDCCFPAPVWAPWEYIGTKTITYHWGGYTDPLTSGQVFWEELSKNGCCGVDAEYDLGYLY